MRLVIAFFVGAALLCASAAGGAPLTNREAFQKKVARVAPSDIAKAKALCVCLDQSDPNLFGRVGVVVQFVATNQVFAGCFGDSFDAAGNDNGNFGCFDWAPLVK